MSEDCGVRSLWCIPNHRHVEDPKDFSLPPCPLCSNVRLHNFTRFMVAIIFLLLFGKSFALSPKSASLLVGSKRHSSHNSSPLNKRLQSTPKLNGGSCCNQKVPGSLQAVPNQQSLRMTVSATVSEDAPTQSDLRIFTLSLNGATVKLCNLGASIYRLILPSNDKRRNDDCVLGWESPQKQRENGNPPYFGVIVGRVANRIAEGKFDLAQPEAGNSEGAKTNEHYTLAINNGPNHLHGGLDGFCHRVWDAEIVDFDGGNKGIAFTLHSPDGDQGYPAAIDVKVTYCLLPHGNDGVSLKIEILGSLAPNEVKSTPINLAQHSYFNLAGHGYANGILDHKVTLPSETYTPVDANLIPTKEVRSVKGDQCMDFRYGKIMSDAIITYAISKAGLTEDDAKTNLVATRRVGYSAKVKGGEDPFGFDHNYVVNPPGENDGYLALAGVVEHVASGRRMTVVTDQPGVQFYSGNFLDGTYTGTKDGAVYKQWQNICLETQRFPNSIGCKPDDETSDFSKGACFILEPGGKDYVHNVEYRFEFRK